MALKKAIAIGIVVLALLLAACGYIVVERKDQLPEGITGMIDRLFDTAYAEEGFEPTPSEAPASLATPGPTEGPENAPPSAPGATDRAWLSGEAIPATLPPASTRVTAVPARPVGTPAPTPMLLTSGAQGDEVKAMQQRLRELGFTTAAADGQFGPRTLAAVNAVKQYLFDLQNAMPQATQATAQPELPAEDSVIDVVDGEDLPSAAPAETATQAPDATPAPTAQLDGTVDEALYELILAGLDPYRADLQKGDRGDDVTRIQTRLNALNYLYAGMDGDYGAKTRSAIQAFQKRGGLPETGIADEPTQRLLFSAEAPVSDRPPLPYVLKINVGKQRVYAYAWSVEDADYTALVRTMVCSTGLKGTPTPIGTFTSVGPVARWGYFPKWDVYAQYLFRIRGGVLFHSVLYRDADESTLISGSLSRLGSRASHGCVRLSVKDAKWIYKNCPAGTTVTVYG